MFCREFLIDLYLVRRDGPAVAHGQVVRGDQVRIHWLVLDVHVVVVVGRLTGLGFGVAVRRALLLLLRAVVGYEVQEAVLLGDLEAEPEVPLRALEPGLVRLLEIPLPPELLHQIRDLGDGITARHVQKTEHKTTARNR
jgi:hypothetical protein